MKKTIFFLIFLFGLLACEKEKDLYYQRPDWLQGPLYEQIKASGEFSEFIDIADYIGYDKFLSSRLTFTLFLPTNEAFQEYYQEIGVNSFKDLDTLELKKLVDFHLLQQSWDSVKMVNKTSWNYWGNIPQNFRTPSYYEPDIAVENGKNVYYENTFLHLYSTPMFQWFGFNAEDYNVFYPGSEFTGFNMDRASIIESQLGSENGFYYVIDRVMKPRTTADNVIAKNPDFSLFKDLLDIFLRYDYSASLSASNTKYDSIFVKTYSLNLDVADEKITDSAPDGYYHVLSTVFVPANQVIIDYFNNNFSAYGGLENVPNIIKKYFVEAHLVVNKKLFPSVLAREIDETNDFSDMIDYEAGDGITSYDMSSNAIIYGVDRALNTNAFSTVSGPIIKNPDFRIFTMMLELSGEMKTFFKREIGHVAFVLSDNIMEDLGFNYFEGDPVDFTDDRIFLNNSVLSNTDIKSFLADYISITYKDLEANDEVYVKTKSGNFLKVTNDKVEGVFGSTNILDSYAATNGNVLQVDSLMKAEDSYTIEDYLNDNRAAYAEFFNLCDRAGITDSDGFLSNKLSLFSGVTVLLPSNEAISAILGSYITPSTTSAEIKQIIQYQIISERVIFTDDTFPSGSYGTDLYLGGVRSKLTVSAGDNLINITDGLGNTISIGPGPKSNIITSNGIIHVVDKVAQF
jgi:uncharacterized surface protein with fasciclin (FAS1) repeats